MLIYPAGEKSPLKLFGITEDDINRLGLQGIKKKAKRAYRRWAFKIHPDAGGKPRYPWNVGEPVTITKAKKWRDYIQNLKALPMTSENMDAILEITKGFKTTADIDLGLNDSN